MAGQRETKGSLGRKTVKKKPQLLLRHLSGLGTSKQLARGKASPFPRGSQLPSQAVLGKAKCAEKRLAELRLTVSSTGDHADIFLHDIGRVISLL